MSDGKHAAPQRMLMLDAMRGIAAICVAAYHMSQFQGSHGPFDRGYLAVDFFFILSGLVLTPIFEGPMSKGLSATSILWKRIVRFWPLMAVGTAIGALQQSLVSGSPPPALLLSMALIFAPVLARHATLYPMNVPQWSLTLEIVANAFHLHLLRRFPFAALLAIVVVCWLALVEIGQSYGSLNIGHGRDSWHAGLARVGCGYVLGCCLARSRDSWSHRLPTRHGWWIAPCVFASALILPVEFDMPAAISDTLMLPAFGLTAALASACGMPSQLRGLAHWLGAISFPLYAIHYPLLQLTYQVSQRATPEWQPYCYPAGAVTVLVVASLLARTGIAKGRGLLPRTVEDPDTSFASAKPAGNLGT